MKMIPLEKDELFRKSITPVFSRKNITKGTHRLHIKQWRLQKQVVM